MYTTQLFDTERKKHDTVRDFIGWFIEISCKFGEIHRYKWFEYFKKW